MSDRRLSQLLKAKLLRRSSTSSPSSPPAPARQNQKSVNVKKNKAAGADPPVDPNSTSDLSCFLPPHLLTPDEGDTDARSRAYSIVSSLPFDHPSTPDDIVGPATGSSVGRDQYFIHFDRRQGESLNEQIQQSPMVTRSVYRQPTEDKTVRGKAQSQEEEEKKKKKKKKNKKKKRQSDDRARTDPDLPLSSTTQLADTSSPPQTPAGDNLLPSPSLPSPSPSAPPPPTSPEKPVGVGAPPLQPTYRLPRERPGATPFESQLTPSLDAVAEDTAGESDSHYFPPSSPLPFPKRPSLGVRRQSLLPASHQHLISGLLGLGSSQNGGQSNGGLSTVNTEMITRKIWVKRPGGSATLVPAMDDSLVDELRDQVIMKYANSLGRTFDSPDIAIRIYPREGANRQSTPERILNPEESLGVVIDSYYPGGQSVDEALIIDIPLRRTPKPSPRHVYHHHSEPGDHGEYFPPMPVNPNAPTPPSIGSASSSVNTHAAPAISILSTGIAPPLPSPGSRGNRHARRPPLTRHTTNSPTMLCAAPIIKDPCMPSGPQPPPTASSIPTPPAPPPESPQIKTHTPPARVASPRLRPSAKLKKGGNGQSVDAAFGGLIEGTVPPINVLIVEDNIINQKLLEAFMKRLSVRWKCAANGEEAVKKWRQGGFHLVLMDIQLPVMNGLEATKEIRRLERLNGIGVFPKTASGRSSASSLPAERNEASDGPLKEADKLHDLSLFKSPVIIVALTASSLQSDRHEALAAGCNDFLTKPVGFPWLEQKVTEWGCMQALIDFEGWRKWRGFADEPRSSSPTDGQTRTLRMDANTVSRKPLAASPSASSLTSRKVDAGPGESKRRPVVPTLAEPIDFLPEDDSSGSGGGESQETLHSPASPLTSVHVRDRTEPSCVGNRHDRSKAP